MEIISQKQGEKQSFKWNEAKELDDFDICNHTTKPRSVEEKQQGAAYFS